MSRAPLSRHLSGTSAPGRRAILSLAVAAGVSLLTPTTHAADNITWLVGFAPGGTADVLSRSIAQQLSKLSGQNVVVENRPGASGAIALQQAAKAAPDGNTLITVPGPLLHATPVPEVGKELRAVAMLAQGPMVLVAPVSSAPADFAALVKAMKANPKNWSYGSSGNGTSQHLAGELMNQMAGTQAIHVPYRGGGQAITDVVGGQIPLAMLGASPVLPHVQSGKLKALAVTSSKRLEQLPQVPTMQEAGLAGYSATQWFSVAAPAKTPDARVQQLNAWLATALEAPAVQEVIRGSGNVKGAGSAKEVEDFLRQDTETWKKLAEQTKMQLN